MEQEHARKTVARVPWNKGKLVGAKPPLRPSHVWSIRTKLQIEGKKRDPALFNLAIDSKLRGCDVVAVRVDDVAPSGYVAQPSRSGSRVGVVSQHAGWQRKHAVADHEYIDLAKPQRVARREQLVETRS